VLDLALEAMAYARYLPDADLRHAAMAAVIEFVEKSVGPDGRAKLEGAWERMSEILQEMLTKREQRGREEGRAEGRAEGLTQSVAMLLRTRFGMVPPEVQERLAAERDVDRLGEWLLLAARSTSLAEFVHGQGAEH